MIDNLISKILKDDCIIFIGDLIYEGTSVPTNSDIAKILKGLFKCPEETTSLPRVAQLYEDEFGKNELINKLQSIIKEKAYTPLRIHHQFAKLPVSILSTTNYDDLLEIAHTYGTFLSVTTDNEAAYSTADRKLIIRLHGRFDRPTSLIITEYDHYRIINEIARIGDILRARISLSTPVFIGCDLEDPILKKFYLDVSKGMGEDSRRAYAIQANVPDHIVRYWKKKNLDYILISPEQFLTQVLTRLKTELITIPSRKFSLMPRVNLSVTQPNKEPFKFLAYFEESDSDIFYGRDMDIKNLFNKIAYSQIVVLYAQSGVGKTSLIKAGLTSILREYGYITIYARAWRDPLIELNEAFLNEASVLGEIQNLVRKDDSFMSIIEHLSKLGHKVVVFLDQFEEFFLNTTITDNQREKFVDFLIYCTSGNASNIHFVISMREDFLAELHDFQQALRTNYANLYRLRSLTREQGIDAIVKPLSSANLKIDEELLNHILNELGDQNSDIYPPQLQIVCHKLFDHFKTSADNNTIKLNDLQTLGGVRLILANYVNEVMQTFPIEKKDLARETLKVLVTSYKTKVKLDEMIVIKRLSRFGNENEIKNTLRTLENHRLIKKEEQDGIFSYELTHEYIIEKINHWISEEEFITRRAQELVDQEYNNWKEDHNLYLSDDRFMLINEERENLQIDDEQKNFLLMTAINLSTDLVYWLNQINVPSEGLFSQLFEAIKKGSSQVRNNAAVALVRLNKDSVALNKCLQVFLSVGNPNTIRLLELLKVNPSFILDTQKIISQRFVERMVRVPGGQFIMGSTKQEIDWVAQHFNIPSGWIEKELPQSSIDLPDFYIDKYIVTNEEFREFDPKYIFPDGKENYPAINVDWKRAREYANWIGKELPSEAEWEKAARGTDGRRFPWGNEFDTKKANSKESGIGTTTPVDNYPDGVSPYGCYDMAGNVFEWTSSLVADYPYNRDDGRENPHTDGVRIMRGGAFSYNFSLLRCALRYDYYASSHSSSSLGFRCVIRDSISSYVVVSKNKRA